MAECMDAFEFFNNTKLGNELKKYIPYMTKRVIIDIRDDDIVTMYVECLPPKSIFNLNWPEVIDKFKIVKQEIKPQSSQSDTEKK